MIKLINLNLIIYYVNYLNFKVILNFLKIEKISIFIVKEKYKCLMTVVDQ